MTILDVILCTIRQSNTYLGGLLIIGTLDHRQLPPVKGKPLMTSPHIISPFEFIVLQHSVRASGDPDFQRLYNIARMYPRHYEEDSKLIKEFKHLVGRSSNPVITSATCRMYSKTIPAKKTAKDYTLQVQNPLSPDDVRIRSSRQIHNPQKSHQE